MGRFKAKTVKVRKVDGLTLVFRSPKAIYMGWNGYWAVFHRWGAPRGSYGGGWQQFRHLLYYDKHITSVHVFELAERFQIPFLTASGAPCLDENLVEIVK